MRLYKLGIAYIYRDKKLAKIIYFFFCFLQLVCMKYINHSTGYLLSSILIKLNKFSYFIFFINSIFIEDEKVIYNL